MLRISSRIASEKWEKCPGCGGAAGGRGAASLRRSAQGPGVPSQLSGNTCHTTPRHTCHTIQSCYTCHKYTPSPCTTNRVMMSHVSHSCHVASVTAVTCHVPRVTHYVTRVRCHSWPHCKEVTLHASLSLQMLRVHTRYPSPISAD